MPSRSSIFSSDALQKLPAWKPSAMLAGGLAVLLLLFLMAVTGGRAWKMNGSRIGKIVRCLELNLAAAQESDEKLVVFMGSSRFHSAIHPPSFAPLDSSGNTRFLNLAQPSFGPWQALVVLRETGKPLEDIDLLVLEINPWTFNQYIINPVTRIPEEYPHEFDVWASFDERFAMESWPVRSKLMASYVPRRTLKQYVDLATGKLEPVADSIPPPLYHSDRQDEERRRKDENFFPENISRYHLTEYIFSSRKAAILDELLDFCDEHSIPVVLVHPPVKASYYDYVLKDDRRRSEFEAHRRFIRGLAERYPVFFWETVRDCNLDDQIFIDYGHFSFDGALTFSRHLANQLRELIAKDARPETTALSQRHLSQ